MASPGLRPGSTAGGRVKGGYDFVIAGGGVIGASIAFHLAELSDASVALFDRGEVCSGGTGRSCAIIRSGLSGIP